MLASHDEPSNHKSQKIDYKVTFAEGTKYDWAKLYSIHRIKYFARN